MKTFLYSYEFRGELWELPIQADTKEEAEHRLVATRHAQYDGELMASIQFVDPVRSPFLWFMAGCVTYAIIHIVIELGVWIW